jgi:hypothetical protein
LWSILAAFAVALLLPLSSPEVAGAAGCITTNGPIAALTATKSGAGYWQVATDGAVFSWGDAHYYGGVNNAGPRGTTALSAGDAVTAMARTASGNGYWILTKTGAVFTFGDAAYRGGVNNVNGGNALSAGDAAVSIATTSTGNGYWILTKTGAVFTFGDAAYRGGINNDNGVNALTIPGDSGVSLAASPTGNGYWAASALGGTFTFGPQFYGTVGHICAPAAVTPSSLRSRIVEIAHAELSKNPTETNNNNVVRYNGGTGALAPYSRSPSPWCAYFASWVWQQAGVGNSVMGHCGNGTASTIQTWAARNREYRPLSSGARIGDLILFGSPNNCRHVAIVVNVRSDGFVQLIGGNESGGYGNGGVRFTNWTNPASIMRSGPAYGYASPLRGA